MKLCAADISKVIKDRTILSHIDLSLESGKIYAFIGHNGCGKTMLFRALSGLMSVTSGSIYLDEKQLKKDFSVLPNIGLLLENVSLYPHLTGAENLQYLAGFRSKIGMPEIRDALSRVGLDPDDKRKYSKYSLGMKQKLAIAQAVMEVPDILFLDEPTNSLDQNSVTEIRKLILEEKKRGALILLASHNPNDIHTLADTVYRMENGSITETISP